MLLCFLVELRSAPRAPSPQHVEQQTPPAPSTAAPAPRFGGSWQGCPASPTSLRPALTLRRLFSFLRCLMESCSASICCSRRGESFTCTGPVLPPAACPAPTPAGRHTVSPARRGAARRWVLGAQHHDLCHPELCEAPRMSSGLAQTELTPHRAHGSPGCSHCPFPRDAPGLSGHCRDHRCSHITPDPAVPHSVQPSAPNRTASEPPRPSPCCSCCPPPACCVPAPLHALLGAPHAVLPYLSAVPLQCRERRQRRDKKRNYAEDWG